MYGLHQDALLITVSLNLGTDLSPILHKKLQGIETAFEISHGSR